jgi:hypothetical protein
MGNVADLDGLEMPNMEAMKMPKGPKGGRKASKTAIPGGMEMPADMPDMEALEGMEMPADLKLMEALEPVEAMVEAIDMEAAIDTVQLATPPATGCTADIGTHTVHNTAGDPKEPWLNLRAASNSGSEVLAKMPDGTCLTVLSPNSSLWYVKVAGGSMDGITGYAHKNYMKALEKTPEPVEEAAAPEAAAPEAAAPEAAAPAAAPAPPAAPKTGKVKVSSKPSPNARISVASTGFRGSAPATLTLSEGSHQIEVRSKSGKKKIFTVDVNASGTTSLCWNFKKSKKCGE